MYSQNNQLLTNALVDNVVFRQCHEKSIKGNTICR